MEISFVGYPSTGYGWECDRKPDKRQYNERFPEEVEDPIDIPIGGPVYETFIFNDVTPGTVLTFVYRRPWGHSTEPLKTVQLLVTGPE